MMKAATFPALLCAVGLTIGPAAMAAQVASTTQQSSTSGPAVGTPVTPNTTTYRSAGNASAGAGAPGVAAKKGTEAGPAPKSGSTTSQ